jgi:hypothetical protein
MEINVWAGGKFTDGWKESKRAISVVNYGVQSGQ